MRLVDFVSGLSVTLTITLHCTGILTCREIVSQGNVGARSHLPFLSAALIGMVFAVWCMLVLYVFVFVKGLYIAQEGGVWAAYGVLVSLLSLILVNLFVAILQSSYFIIYYIYSENVNALRRDGVIAATLFLSPILYCYYVFASFTSQINTNTSDGFAVGKGAQLAFVMGMICNIYTVFFFASPLSSMTQVIKSKETASMSLPLSLMSALSALSWTFYGVLLKDIFVEVPNLIGFILSIAQLTLFVLYPRKNDNSGAAIGPTQQQCLHE